MCLNSWKNELLVGIWYVCSKFKLDVLWNILRMYRGFIWAVYFGRGSSLNVEKKWVVDVCGWNVICLFEVIN